MRREIATEKDGPTIHSPYAPHGFVYDIITGRLVGGTHTPLHGKNTSNYFGRNNLYMF